MEARSLEVVRMDAAPGPASVVEAEVAHSLEADRNLEEDHIPEEDRNPEVGHNPEEDRTYQGHQDHTYLDQDRKDHDPCHHSGRNRHRHHPRNLPFLPSSSADPTRHNHHNQDTSRNDNNLRRCRY